MAVCGSCSGPSTPVVAPEPKTFARSTPAPKTESPWFDPKATRHDFGLVLAGSDVTREHTFRVANISDRPVRVKGIANRKPCCGDVAPIAPRVVEPGQAVEVTITLHIGVGSGPVLHVAAIEVEGEGSEVNLFTAANAHASIVLEETGSSLGPLEPGQTRLVEFLVRSFVKAGAPPPPLEDRTIRSALRAEWTGPPTTRTDGEAGLDEFRRTLAVTLPSHPEPGHHSQSLEVLDGGGAVVGFRRINREVAGALTASPAGLLFTSPTQAAEGLKVVVRTRDGRPFRINSASAGIEGLKVSVDGADARTPHILTARFQGPNIGLAARSGEIVIRTDHPGQPVVKVAVYVTAPMAGASPPAVPEPSR